MHMKTILSLSLPFLFAGALLSCGKEETATDPYDLNYVYIQQNQAYSHTVLYKEGGEFVKPIAASEKLVRVRCTKPAPADLTVSFTPDQKFVDEYNEKNKTDFKLLTGVQTNVLTIRKGEYVSADSLQVTYGDPSVFLGGKDFMLPLSISEVKGDGVVQSVKFRTVVLTYKSSQLYFQLQDFQHVVGKKLDIGGWKVFYKGSETNGSGRTWISQLTDNSSYTGIDYETEASLDIDMQEDRKLASLAIGAFSINRAPEIVGVQKLAGIGADAEVLADWGAASAPGDFFKDAVDEVNFIVHTDMHVNFFKPVEARYIRLILKGRFGDDWWDPGIGELWFYEPE